MIYNAEINHAAAEVEREIQIRTQLMTLQGTQRIGHYWVTRGVGVKKAGKAGAWSLSKNLPKDQGAGGGTLNFERMVDRLMGRL